MVEASYFANNYQLTTRYLDLNVHRGSALRFYAQPVDSRDLAYLHLSLRLTTKSGKRRLIDLDFILKLLLQLSAERATNIF